MNDEVDGLNKHMYYYKGKQKAFTEKESTDTTFMANVLYKYN